MESLVVTHAVTSWAEGENPTRPVLVLVHGFGSTEEHLAGIGRALEGVGVDWVSLRAPLAQGDGFAWFPITTPGRPAPESVEAAAAAVDAWVNAHVPDDVPVIPVGFSQGGTVASHLMRTRFARWQCVALLGSFVLAGRSPDDAAVKAAKARAFSGRGADDQVIAADAVARTDTWLARHTTASTHSYKRLGHAVSSDEVLDLAHWVSDTLPTLE